MRSTGRERWSAVNSWSRKTVSPSLRQSWNQSRQVMRLPVQLWKYSCAMIASIAAKSASVAVAGRRQHVFVVEDVEALVLHRAHVEVGDGDDHEDVEIVFAAERLLVPAHRALERIHRVGAAVFLAGLDIDAQHDVAARHGAEAVLDAARDCRRPARTDRTASGADRARPRNGGRCPATSPLSTRLPLASRTGASATVGLDAGGVDRHHVGPVGEIGDAAEAFGLALRAVGRAGAIKAHELGIGGRVDQRLDLQPERPLRRLRDGEAVGRRAYCSAVERCAVELQRHEREAVAVEHQRRRRRGLGIGLQLQHRAHTRRRRVERDVELDGLDQPVGRAIVLEADGSGLFGAHRRSLSCAFFRMIGHLIAHSMSECRAADGIGRA